MNRRFGREKHPWHDEEDEEEAEEDGEEQEDDADDDDDEVAVDMRDVVPHCCRVCDLLKKIASFVSLTYHFQPLVSFSCF